MNLHHDYTTLIRQNTIVNGAQVCVGSHYRRHTLALTPKDPHLDIYKKNIINECFTCPKITIYNTGK